MNPHSIPGYSEAARGHDHAEPPDREPSSTLCQICREDADPKADEFSVLLDGYICKSCMDKIRLEDAP
jgi:hypothetical protein